MVGPYICAAPSLREGAVLHSPGKDMISLYTSLISSLSLTIQGRVPKGKRVSWVQPQGVKSAIGANTAGSKELLHAHIRHSGLPRSGISDYSWTDRL